MVFVDSLDAVFRGNRSREFLPWFRDGNDFALGNAHVIAQMRYLTHEAHAGKTDSYLSHNPRPSFVPGKRPTNPGTMLGRTKSWVNFRYPGDVCTQDKR
jgi:hypothetical protein